MSTRLRKNGLLAACLAVLAGLAVVAWQTSGSGWQSMQVTATAYNSVPSQTTSADPDIAAWGDRLQPGMRAIAVSRDLIEEGLTYRTVVRIDSLPGEWLVLDKMNKRWTRKIDIYMGTDIEAARQWGRRDVTISWRPSAAASTD